MNSGFFDMTYVFFDMITGFSDMKLVSSDIKSGLFDMKLVSSDIKSGLSDMKFVLFITQPYIVRGREQFRVECHIPVGLCHTGFCHGR